MKFLLEQVRPDIRATKAYHVPDASGYVKLDAMENPYSLAPSIMQELATILAQAPLNRYPDPQARELKQTIRHYAGLPSDAPLVLGNGSDELISMLSQVLAKSGQKVSVLVPTPTFVMYKISALINYLNFIEVPLQAHDFSLNLPAMLEAVQAHQPALIYLSYPNNPTGNLFDRQAIIQILKAAPNAWVVVDEAYQPFADQTWISQTAEFQNLLVVRTVSKAGLAGIRLGYMTGHPVLLEQIEKVRPPYNINVLTDLTARFILQKNEVLQEQANQIKQSRDEMFGQLQALKGVICYPSDANFILIRVNHADQINEYLKSNNILIKNLNHSHPSLENCLRISVGTPQENQMFINAFEQALQLMG